MEIMGSSWCLGSPSCVLAADLLRRCVSSEEGVVDMLWECCCHPCFVLFGLLLGLLGTVLEQKAEAQHTTNSTLL